MLLQKIKMKPLFLCLLFSLLINSLCAQQFQHPLEKVNDTWHSIILNNDILGKVSPNLSDLRIYAINEDGDTLEVPYFLEKKHDEFVVSKKRYRMINRSKKGNNYYFTIKLNESSVINEIDLSFGNKNFNWFLDVEGSQNQKEWFNISEDYRISSIINEFTNYQFTKLRFSPSEFQYYKIKVTSGSRPRISSVRIRNRNKKAGNYNSYKNTFRVVENKEQKQSIISIDLEKRLPISKLQLSVSDSFDYQRPIRINYLVDSTKTQTGWIRNYQSLQSSYISSLEKNEFLVDDVFTSQIQIIVDNYDNIPLSFDKVEVKGVEYQLVARFNNPEQKHFLVYGNEKLNSPRYDIVNFKDKIPEQLQQATIGDLIELKAEQKEEKPLLTNQWWLWGVLIVLIVALGGFTFSMIKGANAQK